MGSPQRGVRIVRPDDHAMQLFGVVIPAVGIEPIGAKQQLDPFHTGLGRQPGLHLHCHRPRRSQIRVDSEGEHRPQKPDQHQYEQHHRQDEPSS